MGLLSLSPPHRVPICTYTHTISHARIQPPFSFHPLRKPSRAAGSTTEGAKESKGLLCCHTAAVLMRALRALTTGHHRLCVCFVFVCHMGWLVKSRVHVRSPATHTHTHIPSLTHPEHEHRQGISRGGRLLRQHLLHLLRRERPELLTVLRPLCRFD